MRFSEGTTKGRFVELNHPEMFQDHEDIIVFTREEFSWMYKSMLDQINHVNDIALKMADNDEWKLMGCWPKIMERIHIFDKNMNMLLAEKPQQAYLDAFLYYTTTPVKLKQSVMKENIPIHETLYFNF